jgi:uncharacterized membrane protein HdeD (DUF308 family)
MTDGQNDLAAMVQSIAGEVKKASGWYIALGVGLVLAGIVLIARPLYAGIALTWLLGMLFIFAGVLYLLNTFMAMSAGGVLFRILLGIVNIGAGAWLLARPMQGLQALTVVLGVALVLGGIAKFMLARAMTGIPGTGGVVISGILSVLLAILIFMRLPSASEVVIGVFIGVDFIVAGWSLATVAIRTRAISSAASATS